LARASSSSNKHLPLQIAQLDDVAIDDRQLSRRPPGASCSAAVPPNAPAANDLQTRACRQLLLPLLAEPRKQRLARHSGSVELGLCLLPLH